MLWRCSFALIIGIQFYSPAWVSAKETLAGPILAEVIKVIDGDTLVVRAKIWLGQTIETKVRLNGIDTPEIRGKCAEEKQLAQQAKSRMQNWVSGKMVYLTDVTYGKYAGRVVGNVATGDYKNLAEKLIQDGLARPYKGKKRQGWCK